MVICYMVMENEYTQKDLPFHKQFQISELSSGSHSPGSWPALQPWPQDYFAFPEVPLLPVSLAVLQLLLCLICATGKPGMLSTQKWVCLPGT